jgi:microsomal dipeptidase-like Zn-dependent dipeptidase
MRKRALDAVGSAQLSAVVGPKHHRAANSVPAATEDLAAITSTGGIAVVFDLEDSAPLDDDLDNLAVLADLGVRTSSSAA